MLFTGLMCRVRGGEGLLGYLEKYPIFPIEKVLRVCEKYGVYDCLSYLYDKMGMTGKSIEVSVKRVGEIVGRGEGLTLYSGEEITRIVDGLVGLCVMNRSEELWEQLFDSINTLILSLPTDTTTL